MLLFVFGQKGVGKTTFIKQLCDNYPNVTVYEDVYPTVFDPGNNDDVFTRAHIEKQLINVGPVVVSFHSSVRADAIGLKHLLFWTERFAVSSVTVNHIHQM